MEEPAGDGAEADGEGAGNGGEGVETEILKRSLLGIW